MNNSDIAPFYKNTIRFLLHLIVLALCLVLAYGSIELLTMLISLDGEIKIVATTVVAVAVAATLFVILVKAFPNERDEKSQIHSFVKVLAYLPGTLLGMLAGIMTPIGIKETLGWDYVPEGPFVQVILLIAAASAIFVPGLKLFKLAKRGSGLALFIMCFLVLGWGITSLLLHGFWWLM